MKKYFMLGITACLLLGVTMFTSCDKDDDKDDNKKDNNKQVVLKENQICYGDKVLDLPVVRIQKEVNDYGTRYYVFGLLEEEGAYIIHADVESNQLGKSVDVSKADENADFHLHINFETQAEGTIADLQLDSHSSSIYGFFGNSEDQRQFQNESMFSSGTLTFKQNGEKHSYILEGTLFNGKRMAFNVTAVMREIVWN